MFFQLLPVIIDLLAVMLFLLPFLQNGGFSALRLGRTLNTCILSLFPIIIIITPFFSLFFTIHPSYEICILSPNSIPFFLSLYYNIYLGECFFNKLDVKSLKGALYLLYMHCHYTNSFLAYICINKVITQMTML